MALHRLAKDDGSVTSGGCPALYSTDDPARMIGQGKVLSAEETAELLELLDDETAVAIPTETVFRGIVKYATEHGDDDLAARLEAFIAARRL
jgi:ATP-dependent protease HslVU (ClpYQ) peptidase subunit